MTIGEAITILSHYSSRDKVYPKEDIEAFEMSIKAEESEEGEEDEEETI